MQQLKINISVSSVCIYPESIVSTPHVLYCIVWLFPLIRWITNAAANSLRNCKERIREAETLKIHATHCDLCMQVMSI